MEVILLCGLASDRQITLVRRGFYEMGVPHLMLDQRDFGDVEVEFELSASGLSGELRIANKISPLEQFIGVYVRLADIDTVLSEPEVACSAYKYRSVQDTLYGWLELSQSRVVGRLSTMGSNSSKPYQQQLINSLGFATPETLVTNDPDLALDFWLQHRKVVYKSISSIRSIVRLLEADDIQQLESILICPTQFQVYVSGTNVRVHTVGDAVYASAIVTDAIDYRYAHREGRSSSLYPFALPGSLAAQCARLAKALELPLAGIDLIITPENHVYCLEVNPSPAFSYYEERTGQPIGRAVARYLAGV